MALTRINGNLISSGTITGNLFLNNTITGNLIAPAAVTGDKIGLTAITSNLIATGVTITSPVIASANLTTALTLNGAAGTNGQVLTSAGSGLPSWTTISSSPTLVRSAITANTTLVAANASTLIDVTSGTITLALTAAATLGSGWFCYIRNSGTGEVTLDPNSSEQIDGLTSYIMYSNECRLVQCTGTAFFSLVIDPFAMSLTSSTTFVTPPGYTYFGGDAWGGGGGGRGGQAFYGVNDRRYGGNGGGGGGRVPFNIKASAAGTNVTVTIGAGGTGGASDTNGGTGGTTSFGTSVTAYGGKGDGFGGGAAPNGYPKMGFYVSSGNGGFGQLTHGDTSATNLSAANNVGLGGGSVNNGLASRSDMVGSTEWGGSGGGAGIYGTFANIGGGAKSIWGATGGGGGGGLNESNNAITSGAGGGVGYGDQSGSVGGGVSGVSAGSNGNAGAVLSSGSGGGGSGGGANGGGAGYIGGAGAAPGGGGGGGGGGTSAVGGAGGAGGAGQINIWGIA